MRPEERSFAEQAIQWAMKDPRRHKVGAVLVRDGSNIGALCGGVIDRDQHAESTLLERKFYTESVKGCTLYVTLEPCMSSFHGWVPSKSPRTCAQIIADREIQRVVIGMADPDPRIYGQGRKYLQKQGIEIDWFPDDLKKQCEELNAGWANEKRAEWKYNKRFFDALAMHRGPRIISNREISVGDVQTLQMCPEIQAGWRPSEVVVRNVGQRFEIPNRWEDLFELYYKVFYHKKRFMDDRDKVMLTKTPFATTDAQTLVLETALAKYSTIQFYKDVLTLDERRRKKLLEELKALSTFNASEGKDRDCLLSEIEELNQGELEQETRRLIEQAVAGGSEETRPSGRAIRFPHALCLQMIVQTRDDKLLIIRRAADTEYRPSAWSCSCEEHMATSDLVSDERGRILVWAQRALREELGLTAQDYEIENLRLLSVFLETDILNVSVCGIVLVNLSENELEQEFSYMPVVDSAESGAWAFLDYDDNPLIWEIFWPLRYYHPTSQYRFLMALAKKSGFPVA